MMYREPEDFPDRLMGLDEICEYLRITKPTLARWRKVYPLIPVTKIGNRVEANRDKLEAWRDNPEGEE